MPKGELITSSELTTAELANMTPDDAVATFTAAELRVFKEFMTVHTAHITSDLLKWYDKGQILSGIYQASVGGEGHYGRQFIDRLAVAAGYDSRFVLDAAIRIVQIWPDQDAFAREIVRRHKGAYRLTWTHLQSISSVLDDRKREKLIEYTFNNQLTTRELRDRVVSKQLTRSPKVKPTHYGTLKECLREIIDKTKTLIEAAESRWIADDYSMTKEFQKTAPDEAADYNDLIEQSSGGVNAAVEALARTGVVLERVRELIAARMAKQTAGTIEGHVAEPDECEKGGKHEFVVDVNGKHCAKCKIDAKLLRKPKRK
jgi:hypothetical protein